jgi:hypothetical protein
MWNDTCDQSPAALIMTDSGMFFFFFGYGGMILQHMLVAIVTQSSYDVGLQLAFGVMLSL